MVDHYSHARDLMHVMWRYSFVQQEKGDSLAELSGIDHNHSNDFSDVAFGRVESTRWGINYGLLPE